MGIDSLGSALSGLNAAQQQLSVIAGNVSNAGTEGYSRKILPQEATTILGVTSGVRTDAVTRSVNLEMEGEFWTQASLVSALNTQVSYLNQIQNFNGSTDAQTNIGAKLSALKDAFTALSDDPSNSNLQTVTVRAAQTVAGKLNSFSTLLTQMRNDTQNDISTAVSDINDKLQQIAKLNGQIKFNHASGHTTAALEDNRDQLISGLSKDIGVSYFIRSDDVMVVQTSQGVQLADETAQTVSFAKKQLSPISSYPTGANGIFVTPPNATLGAIDISQTKLSGKLGALVDLRDNSLPQQQAALDEVAEQLAQRCDQQGLKLFTNAAGQVPSNAAPNLATNPPTPVAYVGFSATIQVNPAVLVNNALVQQGTAPTDVPVQSGSDEVISRIINNAFGTVQHQEADGTVNLKSSAASKDLQSWLGIYSKAQVTGSPDIANYSSVTALMAAGGDTVFHTSTLPATDQFSVTFAELRGGGGAPGTMTVNISLTTAGTDFPLNGTTINNAADQIAAEINKQVAAQVVSTPIFAKLAATASTNSYGQLVIQSRGNVDVESTGAGAMGQAGLNYLGLTAGTTVTTDPYISVQVGGSNPVKIGIIPGEDETGLVADLNKTSASDPGIAGLGVSLDAVTGKLTLMPGDSTTTPAFGGSLTILGSSFQADGTGAIPGGVPAGTSIVAALFGSNAPVIDVTYGSVQATGGGSDFRQTNLGPLANIATGAISSGSVIDYTQQLILNQANTYNSAQGSQTDENNYTTQLQTTLKNDSGVNIDEELSNMIVVQTAYSAAARVISALQDQFKALIAAFE